MYYYPDNLRSEPLLFLWRLKDLAKIGAAALPALFIAAQTASFVPLAVVLAFAFLCVRVEDTSVMEFVKYAVRFFVIEAQEFRWGARAR